jgi:Flp pilus assembly protein TadB
MAMPAPSRWRAAWSNDRGRPGRRGPPIEEHLAVWCAAVARSVRADASLSVAVEEATESVPALVPVFGPVVHAQQRGCSLSTALDALASTDDSVRLVAAVARTCARLGGSAGEPFDRAAAVMHARLAAVAERRVQSAQARLSAVVLTVTPLAVLALLFTVESSVRDAFALPVTWICLTIGLALNLGGWLWMRRIIAGRPRRRVPLLRRAGPTPAQRALPEGIELLVCCLHAGLTPVQLVDAVASDLPDPLQPGFAAVRHRLDRGHRFADALAELPAAIGPDAHSLADSIAACDRYGLPLAPVLERLAAEATDTRRRLSEMEARKLPIRLSFPLVTTVLPSFVLVALAPAAIGALSTLSIS